MTITKALERLSWRFSQRKPFIANQNDINALNQVIEYCDKKQSEQIQNYQLFAKLYVYLYGQFLDYYKTTVFDPIPQKELHKILDKSLWFLIEEFTQTLNESERYGFMTEAGVDMNKHPLTVPESDKKQQVAALNKMLQDNKNMEIFKGQAWSVEDVKENLETQINAAINAFEKI